MFSSNTAHIHLVNPAFDGILCSSRTTHSNPQEITARLDFALSFFETPPVMFNCLLNIKSVIIDNGIPDGIIRVQPFPLIFIGRVRLLLYLNLLKKLLSKIVNLKGCLRSGPIQYCVVSCIASRTANNRSRLTRGHTTRSIGWIGGDGH